MMETVDGGIGLRLGDKRRIQASSVVLHRWSEIIQCVIRRSRKVVLKQMLLLNTPADN